MRQSSGALWGECEVTAPESGGGPPHSRTLARQPCSRQLYIRAAIGQIRPHQPAGQLKADETQAKPQATKAAFSLSNSCEADYTIAMHTSLQPKTNAKLLMIWGVVAFGVAIVASPTPWLFLGVGLVLGVCAGIIQLRALRESAAALVATQTAMEVRRVLSSSRCGRLYLYAFWFSMVVLFALAFSLLGGRAFVGLLAGYSAFAFMRELLTLRGMLELHRLFPEQRA